MENYEEAAKSRLSDWEVLVDNNRKVGAIHMGGIVIECILKGIICSENSGIIESRAGWSNGFIHTNRPSHHLKARDYSEWLEDIYDDMPPDIEDDLEYISRPEGKSYIDYRYVPEDDIAQSIFDKWENAFISVYDYIIEKKKDL